ncbi:MAG TPA: toll/interleukin-1 receptor domain-containing protein [Verrucomicrobiae bacterium]|nr:toll/interleukin-1 receptor domain-containing protein [Verrucomicrobiae bacterium]
MKEESKAENPPRVFVSYSHDTSDHKKWVGEFASKLMGKGIDVILDQWDLGLGDDVPKFMEKAVSESDRVLMICTETYVRKADDGKGGVGYEAMVVTGELVKDLGTAKFIPIVRQKGTQPILPKCVSTRFYVNFSEEQNFDEEFEKLLRELHKVPKLKKPAIGPNPFAEQAATGPEMEGSGPTRKLNAVAAPALGDPAATYATALEFARRNDLIGWRRLIKQIRQPLPVQLLAWRQTYAHRHSMKHAELPPMVLEAATVCAPLMSVALAGVESSQAKFTSQVAVLDDLLSPKDWIGSGLTVVLDVTDAIVFIYQALHGAVCMESDQLPLALQLARSRVQRQHQGESVVVYQDSHLIGWPASLSGHCSVAWEFLADLPKKWPWLLEIFGSVEDYQVALCAYYLALNIQELADVLAGGREEILGHKQLELDVPLMNHGLPQDIRQKAYRLLLRSPEEVRAIWRKAGVNDAKIVTYWPSWIKHCAEWLSGIYRIGYHGRIAHEKLFEDLRPES